MGAFQRSNLYNKSIYDELKRKDFRNSLHTFIKNISLTKYKEKVNPTEHLKNINRISEFSKNSEFSYMLKNGELNFGVSQKLLNLYLKYLWCLDIIKTPPHFPVDRIIQKNLNKKAKELNIKKQNIISWTQVVNKEQYLKVIYYAIKINEKLNYNNLAELELNLFDRK